LKPEGTLGPPRRRAEGKTGSLAMGRTAAERPIPSSGSGVRGLGATTQGLSGRARHFASLEQLRRWFEENHARAKELWIAYPKKGTGGKGVSYAEAVEEALCFGWVDGQVRSLDERTYANRYAPRRSDSRWSRTNVRRALELRRLGRMHPSGLAAFERRAPTDRAGYSSEGRPRTLDPALLRAFQRETGAWEFFREQPPSYRRTAIFWVMSAKREETRRGRLQILMGSSGRRRRIDLLSPGSSP